MSEPSPGPARPLRRPQRRPGWRKRRLRWAAAILVAVAALAAVGSWLVYRATRPETRRPGEELPEITAKLARGLPAEAPTPRFTDVTGEAGLGGFVTFAGERTSQLPEDMGSGAAWGDFDGDGDDDLFAVAAGGPLGGPDAERALSRLYENLGDGTFREVAAFPETRIQGMAAAWGDADGDGRPDLVVTGYGALRLYLNRQEGWIRDERFTDLPGYWAGAAWGDFDNDRDLDLYVCGYVRYVPPSGAPRRASEQYGRAVPYTLNPASFEPERNLLFENDGRGRFREVAAVWGVSNPGGRSLSALWHDFDADGRLDLYVANDISDNALYLNRGDTFEDAGLAAWVADYRGAMGLAAGDWNRDGDDDLFVTHWIAQENALYDSRLVDLAKARAGSGEAADPAEPANPTGSAAGSIQLAFTDLAAPLGLGQIALHSVGWGTEFLDFDGDGWLDLVVANGSTLESAENSRRLEPQRPMLLWNEAGRYFHDLAPLSPPLAAPVLGRGLAVADYDRDGDLDLAIVRLDAGLQLLRNDMQSGRWIALKLRGRRGPGGEARGEGEGSSVALRAGEAVHRRSVTGASYLSQSARTLHFGLGAAERADEVEVRWLGGESQRFGPLEAGAVWELVEGEPEPRRLAGPALAAADTAAGGAPGAAAEEALRRERRLEFWARQREAMDALKRDGDCAKAEPLFRAALALDPSHEDSRYYLGNCLAALGRAEDGLAELDRLRRASPMSHRAHKQWGVLRATFAATESDLDAAWRALERALEINREETGALLALGEIALLRGDTGEAERWLGLACRTNPQSVGGLYLRAYAAWKEGRPEARELLRAAGAARGPDWKPEGAVAEGDVARLMHRESGPLTRFWEGWDGGDDPAGAFGELDAHLRDFRRGLG